MRTRGWCSRGLRTCERSPIWIWRDTFFWTSFWNALFHSNNATVFKEGAKNALKIKLKSNIGLIFSDFLYIVFLNDPTTFLLYFTGSHCSKLQEKHIKSTLEKSHVFYNNILSKKTEKSLKMTSKIMLQMWGRKAAFRFGALLGHLWRSNFFLTPKNDDTVLQKWPQGFKIAPKMTPRVSKWSQKASQRKHLVYKMLQTRKKV